MKIIVKRILCSSFGIAVLSVLCVYFTAFSSLYIISKSGVRISGEQTGIIMILTYTFGSIIFWGLTKSGHNTQHFKRKLLLIYISIICIHCFIGSFIVPQPGGINLVCRILSPVLGPWSRFLPPNAMRLNRMSMSFLIFSGVMSVLSPVSITILILVRNKLMQNIAIIACFIVIFIWSGYGFYRIILDLM